MHVTLAAVMSADGKLTKGGDPHVHSWTSAEDTEHFMGLIHKARLIVMGRNTYEAVRPEPQPERLRVVLTSTPQRFQAHTVPGSLEFSDESPQALVERLEAQGHRDMLLVSGGKLSVAFLQAGLINEVLLTVEPVLFGTGAELLGGLFCEAQLQLRTVKQLNQRGTLLLHYQVTYV